MAASAANRSEAIHKLKQESPSIIGDNDCPSLGMYLTRRWNIDRNPYYYKYYDSHDTCKLSIIAANAAARLR